MNETVRMELKSRADIELLVNTFYSRVQQNNVLAYIFNDVAAVNWEKHLPKMYSFWSSILLGEQSYDGNPMRVHMDLSKQTPLTDVEFAEWIRLFTETVDELFEGDKAEEAKTRAENIARIMLYKISS